MPRSLPERHAAAMADVADLPPAFMRLQDLLDQRRYADVIDLSVRIDDVLRMAGVREQFCHTSYCRGLAERDAGDLAGAIVSFRRSYAVAMERGMFGHAGRAMAAEGRIRIGDARLEERDEGARLVQEAICLKLRCPDRGGIGADFVTLSGYALSQNRLSRALGHGRRGLKLSLMEGRPSDILEAKRNLIGVYLATRLFDRAQATVAQAETWARTTQDRDLIEQALSFKAIVDVAQRRRGRLSKVFVCPCPTNEARKLDGGEPYRFEDCCGPADREPLEVDWGFCLAPQHGPYRPTPADKVFNFTLGEYVDREVSDGCPEGFLSGQIRDGWLETFGLPHLAHYHLRGARAARDAGVDSMDVGSPIAAVLLAVCSLEAFINGVAHIVPDLHATFKQDRRAATSSERSEPEIVRKWKAAGSTLCTEDWLAPEQLRSLRRLVRLRNSLVHFEPGWESLDDAPGKVTLPDCEQRKDALWWPHRVMTRDAGRWAVQVAEQVMAAFKAGLREEFRQLWVSPERVMGKRPA